MRECKECRYHSVHHLGEPFSPDDRCSHPKLVHYNKLDDMMWHKINCKPMRSNERKCGANGRYWEAKS